MDGTSISQKGGHASRISEHTSVAQPKKRVPNSSQDLHDDHESLKDECKVNREAGRVAVCCKDIDYTFCQPFIKHSW